MSWFLNEAGCKLRLLITPPPNRPNTTTVGTLIYPYDATGNRLITGGTFARTNLPPALAPASYNANNQQTAFGTTTETYDLNGNLATTTDASGTTTYTWNARNQLTSISGPRKKKGSGVVS